MTVRVVLAIVLLGGMTACSSSPSQGTPTCGEMAARIAALEAPTSSSDPAWEAVEAGVDRTIERDALKAQMVSQGC